MKKLDHLVKIIMKDASKKTGMICLNCVLNYNSVENLKNYTNSIKDINSTESTNSAESPNEEIQSKEQLIYGIYNHLYYTYRASQTLQDKFGSITHYIGDRIFHNKHHLDFLEIYDFIAKQDLIEVFSDYCADIGINTFDMTSIKGNKSNVDLFLSKKLGRDLFKTKTEVVFIRTGHELEENYNEELLNQIRTASKCAFWTVFVTTSYGACAVGYDKLVKDMKDLNVWLYIIDPVHKNVFGITKGKKNFVDEIASAEVIKSLPKEPIRAPNPLGKISTYTFSEKNSYNPKKFDMFSIRDMDLYNESGFYSAFEPKYSEIFRSLLIIENRSGLSLYSYSSEEQRVDDMIVSGFLSAIDSFALELTGGTKSDLNEITYKGFKVQLVSNQDIKVALFLTEQPTKSLIERLDYFLEIFSTRFEPELEMFKKTNNASLFRDDLIKTMIKKILSV